MTDKVELWALGDSPGEATRIDATSQTETEKKLEDALANHPEMLLGDLTLVGRQIATPVGAIDLLGIDEEGRLVIFELKRGPVTREAVAQLLDYGSFFETQSADDLVELLTASWKHDGSFEEWYVDATTKDSLNDLRPIRMILVGLGADERAKRIVEFLNSDQLDICLLTFHGFTHAGTTILARNLEGEDPSHPPRTRTRQVSRVQKLRTLDEMAVSLGVISVWNSAKENLDTLDSSYPKKNGITFHSYKHLPLGGRWKNRSSHTLTLEHSPDNEPNGRIRVTFFPAAVHLCTADFAEAEQVLRFQKNPAFSVQVTGEVDEEWSCTLSEEDWKQHRHLLVSLCEKVAEAWKSAPEASGTSTSHFRSP